MQQVVMEMRLAFREAYRPLTTQSEPIDRKPSSLQQRLCQPARLVGDDAGSSSRGSASSHRALPSMPGKSRVPRLNPPR